MANTTDPVLGDQQHGKDKTPPGMDLEALAEKIVALLLREIETETERAGKYIQGR